MGEENSFLKELDEAVSRGTPESRKRALWHATDLLITGRYSDDEIGRSARSSAGSPTRSRSPRGRSSRSGWPRRHAPLNVVHKLAFDDAIDVAGPMLRIPSGSTQALIANA